jgi:hypothetical protein
MPRSTASDTRLAVVKSRFLQFQVDEIALADARVDGPLDGGAGGNTPGG